jgi:hypothetical protein
MPSERTQMFPYLCPQAKEHNKPFGKVVAEVLIKVSYCLDFYYEACGQKAQVFRHSGDSQWTLIGSYLGPQAN